MAELLVGSQCLWLVGHQSALERGSPVPSPISATATPCSLPTADTCLPSQLPWD